MRMTPFEILLRIVGGRVGKIPKRPTNLNRLQRMIIGGGRREVYFIGRSCKWTRWKK
jgi:hypothetical protein